jgi:hypothetical protein
MTRDRHRQRRTGPPRPPTARGGRPPPYPLAGHPHPYSRGVACHADSGRDTSESFKGSVMAMKGRIAGERRDDCWGERR